MSSNPDRMTSYRLAAWQGYYTEAEVDLLHNLAADLPADAIVVKIGAGAGTDTLAILETTESVVIFSIDILAGESPTTTNEHLRLPEAGYADTGHVIRIWGDSKVVCKRWPLQIDMLIIDGDHSEAGVRGDIEGWWRHVKEGGWVVFHDYGSPNWPAVRQVVDHLLLFRFSVLQAIKDKTYYHEDTIIALTKFDLDIGK